MYRLGLRLVLKSGREAFVRLVATSLAVAIGVAILLSILAEFHAFQATSNRPSWESTPGRAITSLASAGNQGELWNYSESIYKGRFIEILRVAPLGPNPLLIPGLSAMPAPGTYYASPALSGLLKTVPADQLGNRFPGKQAGILGDAALSGPGELVIVLGYSPAKLAALGGTTQVSHIASAPQLMGTTNIYRLAFGIAAIIVLFPLFILINTATKLAAARREERLAALRLVGATPRQTNVLATVEAVVIALVGAVLGALVFLAIRPALESLSFSGVRFFPYTVTPTLLGYLAVFVLVPILAALSSLISLQRVWVTPLGVSRRSAPRKPGWWRVVPLVVGVPLFVYPIVTKPSKPATFEAFAGLFLIMVGLVLGGPWLTMQISRLFARTARGPSGLLAARRLADNPRGAFRASAGLVLAVFAGSFVACIVPAFNAAQSQGAAAQLTNVLKVPLGGLNSGGLSPGAQVQLLDYLQSQKGVTVIPAYDPPGAAAPGDSVIECSTLAALPVLGKCAPGAQAVEGNLGQLISTDNPIFFNQYLPVVNASSTPVSQSVSGMRITAMLVKTANAGTLERIRTYITQFEATATPANVVSPKAPGGIGAGQTLTAYQMGVLEPETFGEVAQTRLNDDKNIERVVFGVMALILIVAGCSLAVSVAGGMLDRKRPFTLLRLSGAPLSTLAKVVMLESVVPLVAATVVAAGVAIAVAEPPLRAVFNANMGKFQNFAAAAHPSLGYYVTVVAGLALSALVVLAAMPLLGRITRPENARFE